MTPRLWEDVSELQKQAKLKDNVIFSAQGAPKKSWGTYFHVKSKNKMSLQSQQYRCLFNQVTQASAAQPSQAGYSTWGVGQCSSAQPSRVQYRGCRPCRADSSYSGRQARPTTAVALQCTSKVANTSIQCFSLYSLSSSTQLNIIRSHCTMYSQVYSINL